MLIFLQPAPDVVGAMPVQRIPENLPDNRGGFLVYQQAVPVLRVFLVAERGKTAGELAFLRFQHIGRMDFLGNILAVHLIQDIFEWRNVVVVPHGVDTVIHGDVAHAVPWEEVLDKLPGLQVVSS